MNLTCIQPSVSILTPVYNAAPFLLESINSILHQSFEDFEFIIINDGSTDNSLEILNGFSDPRIVLLSQENQGVARTLNKAVGIARGKYILRHDADDISFPDKIQFQYNFLESHPEYALCATQIAFMTERGKIAWSYRQPRDSYFAGLPYVEVKRNQFNPYSPITHATILMRSDVMRDLNGYRTEFKTAEDVDLWLRLIGKYRAVVLNECKYFVRLNKTSATQIHGWKNDFFRNKAFEYFDQRLNNGRDDLEMGKNLIETNVPGIIHNNTNQKMRAGMILRKDILDYYLPLHINAKDWKEVFSMIGLSIRDGWRIYYTWKSIFLAIASKRVIQKIVALKRVVTRK